MSGLLLKPQIRRFATSICPPPPRNPIVTLLDSTSTVGKSLAFLLKQNPRISELRLFDEYKNTNRMVNDLNNIDSRTRAVPFSCKSLRDAITGAHLVISTGGCQTKPDQPLKELFEKNLDNVRNVATYLSEFNPTAIYCIAKSPVEALVPMVAEEYKKADSYDPRKIIGVTTPASMIANMFIGRHLMKNPESILCPVIGGFSPKTTIPVISQTRPTVDFNSKVYTKLHEDISNGEEALLKNGTMFCYSRAVAISRFINLVLKALKGDPTSVECAFVAQIGHIKDFLPYMTSIVKLGPDGVTSTHMPRLNEFEASRLKAVRPIILENIVLGQTFLNGEFVIPPQFRRKKCDSILQEKLKECSLRDTNNANKT